MSDEQQQNQELQSLAVKLKGQGSARRVWEQVLSPAERKKVPLEEFLKTHAVDQYASLRRVSPARAVLDLAYGIDLLTVNQYERLLRDIGEVDRQNPDQPLWDVDRCKLFFRGHVIRKIRSRSVATGICRILDAFQEEGWPSRIDDPLPDGSDPQRLRETIRTLNTGLTDIKFLADGTGEGVRWDRI